MKKHSSKMIAPIIITLLILVWFAIYGIILLVFCPPFWLGVVFFVMLAAFASVSIYVLLERIQEIRSGEEDDLSKY